MTTQKIPVAGIVRAGPAGLAAALALAKIGWKVRVFERYPEVRAAGNILNLWPAPQKALRAIGVDTTDLGAPAFTQLRRHDGHVRAEFFVPDEVAAEYNGGFIGLIRWGLYKRMLDALPEGVLQLGRRFTGFVDEGTEVELRFEDRQDERVDLLVGADGVESSVRTQMWGPSPRRHHGIYLLGGWFLSDEPIGTRGVFAHDRKVQGSHTPIRHEGRDGYEWWVVERWEPGKPYSGDIRAYALGAVEHFDEPLPSFIRRTAPENTHRWEIIDRKPMNQWSKGRVTIIGDTSHATSHYAAYGAGMSIEDGYFLARHLKDIDASDSAGVRNALQKFEDARKPHTAAAKEQAYFTGKIFHRIPAPLRPLRDLIFDHTSFLQKNQGDGVMQQTLSQMHDIGDGSELAV